VRPNDRKGSRDAPDDTSLDDDVAGTCTDDDDGAPPLPKKPPWDKGTLLHRCLCDKNWMDFNKASPHDQMTVMLQMLKEMLLTNQRMQLTTQRLQPTATPITEDG